MTEGTRLVHPVHAFGRFQSVSNGQATILLDNGTEVESPLHEWEEVYVDLTAILDVGSLTDDELDAELERFRTMRVTSPSKRPRTRAAASREVGPTISPGDLAALLDMARGNPALAEALRNTGIDVPDGKEVTE